MTDYVKQVIYQFMCDKCGCSDEVESSPREGIREAIKEMRGQGWKIGRDKNICPACQKVKG